MMAITVDDVRNLIAVGICVACALCGFLVYVLVKSAMKTQCPRCREFGQRLSLSGLCETCATDAPR